MWAVDVLVCAMFAVAGSASGMSVAAADGSNCQMSYEEIRSQKCAPETVEACLTVDFPTEDVEYKRVCKDVTSVHCPTTRTSKLAKRDAEAQWPGLLSAGGWPFGAAASAYQPIYQTYPTQATALVYPTYQPSVTAASLSQATATVTEAPAVDAQCHQVTTEHCLSQPIKVSKTLPVKKCHQVTRINCEPYVQKVPKTTCKPVSTPARINSQLFNPFAYGRLRL